MSDFRRQVKVKGKTYVIKPSQVPNKKYTAWLAGPMQPHPELKGHHVQMLSKPVHFGDKRYSQYHDKFGYYSKQDNKSEQQRENYRKRHAKTHINCPCSPAFWSWHYLW